MTRPHTGMDETEFRERAWPLVMTHLGDYLRNPRGAIAPETLFDADHFDLDSVDLTILLLGIEDAVADAFMREFGGSNFKMAADAFFDLYETGEKVEKILDLAADGFLMTIATPRQPGMPNVGPARARSAHHL